jgi:hypothetical protein
MSVYVEGKTLLELREEIEVKGLAIGPLDDDNVYIAKHPEGFLYYHGAEGWTWSECTTTLEELLVTDDDYDYQEKLRDASKPIWAVLPDHLQADIKDNHPRSRKQIDEGFREQRRALRTQAKVRDIYTMVLALYTPDLGSDPRTIANFIEDQEGIDLRATGDEDITRFTLEQLKETVANYLRR